MLSYSIEEIVQSTERHKLFVFLSSPDDLVKCINWLNAKKIHAINVGKELAAFIDGLEDFSYLNIDVFDYVNKLIYSKKKKINDSGNEIVAIYNLGILLEPELKLNATQLLKDVSKASTLLIIWENKSEITDTLHWSTQKNSIVFDFTETPLKKLQYAI